ncbi:hypothetical protein ACR3I8_11925 [Priestia flexa]|uniref:hypothetical protein n=1 Tax=Priestia flexa TaxID=86664 RepID=UPI0032EFC67D
MKDSKWISIFRQSIPATLRIFLGIVFLIYGSVKIVFGQFGEPTPEALALNGEGFVMAWRFFGYSKEYEIIIGIGEVVAAILIMIPRTALFGAICYFPIVINVMMINYFFDIGVQDLSTVLTLMCLALLFFERKRLIQALFVKEEGRV